MIFHWGDNIPNVLNDPNDLKLNFEGLTLGPKLNKPKRRSKRSERLRYALSSMPGCPLSLEFLVLTSRFQEALETVESLPLDDQTLLIEIVHQRLIDHRRSELAKDIAEGHKAYKRGDVRRGTIEDLEKELSE